MISIISPAKTLDFDSSIPVNQSSQPDFIQESEKIITKLKKTSRKKISNLMDLSKQLTELNYERYHNWEPEFNSNNSRQAIYAFKGDVYLGLEAYTLDQNEVGFAQEHLRILSGLHGILRPLDLIQPYRLEMGTDLKIGRRNNLYKFWIDKIYKKLNEAIENSGSKILLNLASDEYFKAVDTKKIKADIAKCVFKDYKNGQYKVLSFFAKKARGQMARYIIQNQINNLEALKSFQTDGYLFSDDESDNNTLVFLRN